MDALSVRHHTPTDAHTDSKGDKNMQLCQSLFRKLMEMSFHIQEL